MPQVFGMADDILIVGFDTDGRNHDVRLEQVLCRCRQANLKQNKEKCLFSCTCIPFIGELIFKHSVTPDPAKVKSLIDMLPPKTKRKPQWFLGIINYLSEFSPTAEVCKPNSRIISVHAVWKWNGTYQEIYKRAKFMMRQDTFMDTMMPEKHFTWKQAL